MTHLMGRNGLLGRLGAVTHALTDNAGGHQSRTVACSQEATVRPEGAEHQWRKEPPRELSVDLVANERGGRVTGRLEAS